MPNINSVNLTRIQTQITSMYQMQCQQTRAARYSLETTITRRILSLSISSTQSISQDMK